MTNFENSFDETVLRAIEKWPNVPDCYDWISLDRRGNWLIKNELITHPRAINFIGRHYAGDEHGRWYIQNGPQRVFCELAYTPFIYRLEPDMTVTTHTAVRCQSISQIILDDEGNILFDTNLGIGLLDDRDLVQFCAAVEKENAEQWMDSSWLQQQTAERKAVQLELAAQTYPLSFARANDVPELFGFCQRPAPMALDS